MKKPSEKKITRGVSKLLKAPLKKILEHPNLTKDQFESAFNILLVGTSTRTPDFAIYKAFALHKYFDDENMKRLLCHQFHYSNDFYHSNTQRWMYNEFLVYAHYNYHDMYLEFQNQFSYSYLQRWGQKPTDAPRTKEQILRHIESYSSSDFYRRRPIRNDPDTLLKLLDISNDWIYNNKALALVSSNKGLRDYSTLYLETEK